MSHTGRRALALLFLAFCALFTHAALRAQEVKDVRYYSQQAQRAYKEKNYAAYLENMQRAVELRPGNPTLLYNLAGAFALNGRRREALEGLSRVAEMGLVYAADADEDFNSLKDTEEFRKILKRFASNKAPVVRSSEAFTIHEKGLLAEGVAYDALEDAFYVGSVRARKIFKVGRDGRTSEFASERDGLWSVMGMKVDAARRHLWVATAAVPQMMNYRKEEEGQSGVLKFDLKTGKLLGKFILPNSPRPHWLGDLVINSRGDVFATDSLTPALYVLMEGGAQLEPLIEGAPFVSPQGLCFDEGESRLFLADYSKGLFVYDLKTRSLTELSSQPNVALVGIDGLYFYRGSLIAIQNGTRPHRLARVSLSKDAKRAEKLEVIEANNPLFDEPTLGVVVKDNFYYVANSQWGAFDRTGSVASPENLRETLILKMKL
ncbi:MAG TPA: hypothetical protein VJS44_12165 [Pyrinomonadaceae bacterium]|nr:hypothetical protein [Pyrinomonadaceae bacterium]